MKRKYIILFLLLFTNNLESISIAEHKPLESNNKIIDFVPLEPKIIYDSNELIRFGTSGDELVTCWLDGTICKWDWRSGKQVMSFKIQKYDYVTQKIFISNLEKPLIAVVDSKSTLKQNLFNNVFYGNIYIYDLLSGTMIKKIKIKDAMCLYGLGFSKNGRFLFCWDPIIQTILCVDCQTGKTKWRSEYEEFVTVIYPCIGENGQFYVNFDSAYIFAAFDIKGKLLWKKETWKNLLQPILGQPDGPSDLIIVFSDNTEDEQKSIILGMSIVDGRVIWERKGFKFDSIRATTNDRKKQAFFVNSELQITNFPGKNILYVGGITEKCDAVFTNDGSFLLCLPALEKTGEDEKNNTVKMQRSSRILKVVECKTGKIVRQLELTKPFIN